MCSQIVTSGGNPAGYGRVLKLEAETINIGCTVFMDGGGTLLDSEAPPRLVFGD